MLPGQIAQRIISWVYKTIINSLHVCILYINVIISYSFKEKKMNNLIVLTATFEITQDALREYKTLHFEVFLLNIHRFKLRKH